MGLLSRLDRWMFREPPETHNIDKMKLWGTGEDIGDPVHAGVFVSQESALRLSVVWRCIDLIAGTLAGLPAEAVRKQDDIRLPVERPPRWLETPNPESNWLEFAERCFESLLMDGNAFVLVTSRDFQGFPAELWTLNPRNVQVRRRENTGRIYFLWNGQTELSRYGPDNPLGDVLHIRLKTAGGVRGLSPLDMARQAIGLGLVEEKFGAKFFGRGQTMSGVIQLPAAQGGTGVAREHIELMRETWEAQHSGSDNAHRPGILTGGAIWQGITITPEDAQFLESRSFQVEDIATRFFGVPAHLVGLNEKQTSFGSGVAEQAIGLYRYTLKGYLTRFETAMSQLLPPGQYLRLNHRALLEADPKTEAGIMETELRNGIINFDYWRAKLDLPPRPGGDRYTLPANNQVILQANGLLEEGEATDSKVARNLVEMVQKVYLGVGVLITDEEARDMLNRAGANLKSGFTPNGNGQQPAEVTQP
jgi:HK97 family phage portal protein